MPVLSAEGTDLTDMTLRQVRQALALVATDPTALALLDGTRRVDPDGALAGRLYAGWWCAPEADTTTAVGPTAEPAPSRGTWLRTLVSALDEARRTTCDVSVGWLVLARDAHTVVAARVRGAGEVRTVPVDAVVDSSRPGTDPRPGDLVSLLDGSAGVQPGTGWWWARSAEDAMTDPGDELDRLYLHCPPEGAPTAVAAVLRTAAHAAVPVALKCPSEQAGFGRRDAVVVYHRRRDTERLLPLLPDLADTLRSTLLPGPPPLTQPVGDSIGRAQDPGGDVSYGQLRCAQVALVVARVLRRGPGAPEDAAVLAELAATGIDAAAPHLVAGAA